MLNNRIDLNEIMTTEKGRLRFEIGNQRYEIRNSATDEEIIVIGIVSGIVACAFAPVIIPTTIACTGLFGSLYGIASILKNK